VSADAEEVLRALAAAELSILDRLKELTEKLDRLLVVVHDVQRTQKTDETLRR
jgi:hypothetical protein